jgi:hypothetical protein
VGEDRGPTEGKALSISGKPREHIEDGQDIHYSFDLLVIADV